MKEISNDEARRRIGNYQQALTTHDDNIKYWVPKIGEKLDFIDSFILGTDGLNSAEEFIIISRESQNKLLAKINDCKKYLTEPYRRFIY